MFDPRDISSDPRRRTPEKPKRDRLKERQERKRTGSRAEFDPRSGRADFTGRTERAVAEIGMYRTVAYKDLSEAHFEGHPYTTRRAARVEQGKLIEKGAVLKRVRIDAELKREVARASETARVKGGKEAADAARVGKAAELGLPVKAGKVEYPDAQLEYDLDGRSGRVNVEIATEHYSTKSIGAKAAAGFAVHGSNGRAKARVARALGRDDGNSGGGGGGKDRDPASFEL